MRCAICAIGILTVASLSVKLSAATVTLDTLMQGSLNYTANGANVVNGMNETGVDTINGMRASAIDHLFAPGVATVTLNTGGPLTASGDNFDLELGYGMTYSGGGMVTGPDLNANLSTDNAFKVTFGSASNGVGIQTYVFTHNSTAYSDSDNNGHGTAKSAGAGDAIIPFSALTNMTGGGANFSKADSILFSFQSQGSFTITQVSVIAIPEPALLAPLLVTIVLRRHRQ